MSVQVRRWLLLSVIGWFFFMVIVDGSIVTIALPAIARAFSISTSTATLIISSYLVTICASLLLFGQIGNRFGRSRVFRWGTVIFLLGSFLAGYGHDFNLVLGGRFIQGIGASMTMANSYALVTDIFPAEQLGRAFGIEGIFISLGALAGPGLGGLILAHLPWNAIFWVNLPFGVVCLVVEWGLFPRHEPRQPVKIDGLGAVTMALAAIALYLATSQVSYWPVCLFASGLLGYLFWRIEQHQETPLLDFKIFHHLTFSRSLFVAFLSFIVSYFFAILAPLYLQLVLNYSPGRTGLLLMVTPLVSLVASPVAGYLSDRYDRANEMLIGMIILAVTQLSLAFSSGRFEPVYFIINAILLAIGTAIFGTPNNVIVMQSVPVELHGLAGATNSLVREFGLVLGTTFSTLIFYRLLSLSGGHHVTSAIGASTAAMIKAQCGTYLIATVLLFSAVLILLWGRRKEQKGIGTRRT